MDGLLLGTPVTPQSLEKGLSYQFTSKDVLVAGYPKSGNQLSLIIFLCVLVLVICLLICLDCFCSFSFLFCYIKKLECCFLLINLKPWHMILRYRGGGLYIFQVIHHAFPELSTIFWITMWIDVLSMMYMLYMLNGILTSH